MLAATSLTLSLFILAPGAPTNLDVVRESTRLKIEERMAGGIDWKLTPREAFIGSQDNPILLWVGAAHPLGTGAPQVLLWRSALNRHRADLKGVKGAAVSPDFLRAEGAFERKLAAELGSGFQGVAWVARSGEVLAKEANPEKAQAFFSASRMKASGDAPAFADIPPAPSAAPRMLGFVRDADGVNPIVIEFDSGAWLTILPEIRQAGQAERLRYMPDPTLRHLWLDAARGIPAPWGRGANITWDSTARIESASPTSIAVDFRGQVVITESGEWALSPGEDPSFQTRGISVDFLGRGRLDPRNDKWTTLEIVGTGSRWGGSPLSGRQDQSTRSDLALYWTLGEDSLTKSLPPLFSAAKLQ